MRNKSWSPEKKVGRKIPVSWEVLTWIGGSPWIMWIEQGEGERDVRGSTCGHYALLLTLWNPKLKEIDTPKWGEFVTIWNDPWLRHNAPPQTCPTGQGWIPREKKKKSTEILGKWVPNNSYENFLTESEKIHCKTKFFTLDRNNAITTKKFLFWRKFHNNVQKF